MGEHADRDAHRCPLLHLSQVADMGFERIDGAMTSRSLRIVEADRIEQCVAGITEKQHVERIAQMAVVVDPFAAYDVAVFHQWHRNLHDSACLLVIRRNAIRALPWHPKWLRGRS